MISNRCARKYLVTNCNSIISKNYLRFLVDSNDTFYSLSERCVITQKRDHLPLAGSPSHFFRVEDQVFYAPAFESVVYEVRDTAFVPAFCFDFGKYNNDLSALADFDRVIVDDREMEDFLNRNFNSFINKMWGSRDYLCLMMSCKVKGDWENRFLFLDRNTREYIVATDFIESFPFSHLGILSTI